MSVDETAEAIDFWSFVDYAVERASVALPDIDPEATRLVLALNRAAEMLVYDLESSVHRPRGLSFAGFRVLFVLWVAGAMESRRVVELTGMSRAAVSALVKTLERDGFVRRRHLEHDRRMVEVSLSERGEAEIARTFAAHNRREQRWVQDLSPQERETVVVVLRKLMEHRAAEDVRRRS